MNTMDRSQRVLILGRLVPAFALSIALATSSGAEETLLAATTIEPRDGIHLQSPIDLPPRPPKSASTHEISIHYADTAEHLIHRDHTIEIQYDPGSAVEFDGRQYDLEQLHFHTPSEHLIAHRRFPVELHLVHHDGDGRALVLGLLFEVGPPNPFLERILEDAPRDIGRIDLESHLDVSRLFPEDKHFYAYEGSLTTAPYHGGIQWLILSEHPTVSPEQVVRLLVLEGGNARQVQPLNGRPIDGS